MTLENNQNTSYIGKLSFGTPPQELDCIFDTGSANPWVLSSAANTGLKAFDSSLSSTFTEPEDKRWVEITFGSGEVKGYFVNDTVTLGDPNDKESSLSVANWTFG